jgi:hypothetical protein
MQHERILPGRGWGPYSTNYCKLHPQTMRMKPLWTDAPVLCHATSHTSPPSMPGFAMPLPTLIKTPSMPGFAMHFPHFSSLNARFCASQHGRDCQHYTTKGACSNVYAASLLIGKWLQMRRGGKMGARGGYSALLCRVTISGQVIMREMLQGTPTSQMESWGPPR